jgi:hypothetical protein
VLNKRKPIRRRSNKRARAGQAQNPYRVWWQGAGGFYRLGTRDLADTSGKNSPSVTVDTYFGARYTYLDISLDIKGFKNVDGDKHWTINLTGDIGGVAFGSDFAWNALGRLAIASACSEKTTHRHMPVIARYPRITRMAAEMTSSNGM